VSLRPLLESRRIVLCVGSGGVGKTTTAAALGLSAALLGKRTLCLTVDPAHRLAESLGLSEMTTEAQEIDKGRFVAAGLDVPGSLTVMMLDTKRTFDDLIAQYASSPEARDSILNNKIYQYVSTSLAGTREYMAMEKLYAIKRDPTYDVIVLDTPPTTNALDFLEAPGRMVDVLGSGVLRWFASAFETSGKLSLNLLARSTALVLRGIGRLTGRGFLEGIAEFIARLNELFGGFAERAEEVAAGLRAPDVAYVLVTSPDPMSIREVLFFNDRLREQGMPRDALVVNRVHARRRGAGPSEQEIARALERHGITLGPDGPARVRRASDDEARRGDLDATHLEELERLIRGGGAPPVRVDVPAFAHDVHDLSALAEVSKVLLERRGAP
jgi:anion-transporting  ArsA/GET3 family ATPase